MPRQARSAELRQPKRDRGDRPRYAQTVMENVLRRMMGGTIFPVRHRVATFRHMSRVGQQRRAGDCWLCRGALHCCRAGRFPYLGGWSLLRWRFRNGAMGREDERGVDSTSILPQKK